MPYEQELARRISQLIHAGHHLDAIPGRPGAASGGGGPFQGDRQVYFRGTDEFNEAAAHGVLDRLPAPPPPASPTAIAEAESLLGLPMPPLLRSLYGLANGGFGPGNGLLGLRGGHTDGQGRTVVHMLRQAPGSPWPGMAPGLVPLCPWGCGIYSFVDVRTGSILGWDPNPVPPGNKVPFFVQGYRLADWLEAWLAGTLLQPWLIVEPDGRYRGATIEETRAAMAEDY